jgi:hypothetical protein
MNKIPIAEGRIQGNLQTINQVYKVNYMPYEVIEGKEYNDKIELAIMFDTKSYNEAAYRSIRFESLPQLKSIIINLIKAYFFFARQKKEITMENYRFKKVKFIKDIEGAI